MYKLSISSQYAIYKSTIFRTIKDEITGVNKSIGLFGLSLSDFKNKINGIKVNGIKELLFKPTIDIDEDAINRYNQRILDGVFAQDALAEASKNTNEETIALMKSANGAIVTTDQLTAAQKASTIAAKAQSVAMGAFKTAVNVGIAILATWATDAIITKVQDIVNAYENGIKKISDLSKEVKSLESEQSSLNSELKESQERLYELQNIKMPSLFEEEEIENLKEYNKQLELQIRLKNLELEEKNKEANQSAQESYNNFINSPVENGKSRKDLVDEAIETYKRIEKAYQNAVNSGDKWAAENNEKFLENLKEHYKDMLIDYSEDLSLMISGLDPTKDGNSELIKNIEDILATINEVYGLDSIPKTPMEVYKDAKFSSITVQLEALAKQGQLTEETFNNVDGIDEFKQALEDVGHADISEIIYAINNEVNKSEDYFNNGADAAAKYAEALTKIKEATSEVLKNSDLFKSAIEKQQGGEDLTYDEVMCLIDLDPSIAASVQQTADGYSIAIQTLIDANKNYVQDNGVEDIKSELDKTAADIADAESKIKKLNERKIDYISFYTTFT